MLYLDTNVIVPLVVPELTSKAIRSWFEGVADRPLTTSAWTLTECASAMGIKVRERRLSPTEAEAALRLVEEIAERSLTVVVPSHADFALAGRYLRRYALGLRAGDALHVAVAANAGAETVYSLDRRMIAACQKLKLRAQSPLQPGT